jgi:WD40 repeat protein
MKDKNKNKNENAAAAPADELPEYRQKREERLRQKRRRRRRIIAAAVLCFIALYVGVNWDKFSPSSIAGSFGDIFGSFGTDGFPLTVASGDFKYAQPVGSNIAVLTDTSVLFYNQSGSLLAQRQHGMSSPCIAASGGKAVVYDRGGKTFRIETRFDEPYTGTMDQQIISAGICSSGRVCIVTGSSNYLGELTVLNADYEKIFKWYSSKGHILTAALSPDGKRLAAVVLSAQSGVYHSVVYVFDLGKKDPIAAVNYDSTMLFSLSWEQSDSIVAVGDTQAVFLTGSGAKRAAYSYGDNELRAYACCGGTTALAFRQYSSGASSQIVSLSQSGAVLGKTQIKYDSFSLCAGQSGIAALTQDGIWHCDAKCANAGFVKMQGDKLSAVIFKGNLYVFTRQTMSKYKLAL